MLESTDNKIKVNIVSSTFTMSDAEENPKGKLKPAMQKRISDPARSYGSRNSFAQPEYDLEEINRIEDVEAYVRQTHRKKRGLAFKEGWDLVAKDQDALAYVNRRMLETGFAQGKPWRILLKEIINDLVTKSNAYLVKARNPKISSGQARRIGGSSLKPVAGYFIMPPETVEIKRNEYGKVIKYKQTVEGKEKEFSPNDVVHFYIDKKTGFATGTPLLTPVIDDIRTLRRIEENIDLLVYQNLFPLFQYQVGTDNDPAVIYPDGSSEIDVVQQEIEYMPPEGMIVTPERHSISLIGSEGRALRAEGYLKHFRDRVFAGLGVSTVDFGEGGTSNRSTADTMSQNLRDEVKDIQDDFEAQFDYFVIQELMLEGSLDITDSDKMVHLQFKEINKDQKIAWQNHMVQLFTQHAINFDELRVAIGHDPKTPEDEEWWEQTYWKLIQEPELIIQSIDERYLPEVAAENNSTAVQSGNVSKGDQRAKQEQQAKKVAPASGKTSGQRSGAARNRPANQHGTRTGPKTNKDFIDNLINESFQVIKSDVLFYKNTSASEAWIDRIIDAWHRDLTDKFKALAAREFRNGVRASGLSLTDTVVVTGFKTVETYLDHYLLKLRDDISRRAKKYKMTDSDTSVLDISKGRLNAIYNTELTRSYNYGKLMGYRSQNIETVYNSASESDCEECSNFSDVKLKVKKVSIADIPPHHPNCKCSVGIKNG